MKGAGSLDRASEWLTVADVAEMLRFSRKHIYRMIRNDQLPAYKFSGREYRIHREEFEHWLETRKLA